MCARLARVERTDARMTSSHLRRAISRLALRVSSSIVVARAATTRDVLHTSCATWTPRHDRVWRSTRPFASDVDRPASSVTAEEPKDVEDASPSTPNARKDLYMMFTCGRCDARAARGFSRQAYENGVVIVTCPGCQAKHVVADRMGWFGEPGSVEDFIAEKADAEDGEGGVARGSMKLVEGEDGTLEIDKSELEEWLKKFTASKGA